MTIDSQTGLGARATYRQRQSGESFTMTVDGAVDPPLEDRFLSIAVRPEESVTSVFDSRISELVRRQKQNPDQEQSSVLGESWHYVCNLRGTDLYQQGSNESGGFNQVMIDGEQGTVRLGWQVGGPGLETFARQDVEGSFDHSGRVHPKSLTEMIHLDTEFDLEEAVGGVTPGDLQSVMQRLGSEVKEARPVAPQGAKTPIPAEEATEELEHFRHTIDHRLPEEDNNPNGFSGPDQNPEPGVLEFSGRGVERTTSYQGNSENGGVQRRWFDPGTDYESVDSTTGTPRAVISLGLVREGNELSGQYRYLDRVDPSQSYSVELERGWLFSR